jgi:hypothetical protein
VVNASGNQDQPESYVNECVLFRVLLDELQRATGVRECMEQSDKMHEDARNGKRNTAREVVRRESDSSFAWRLL